MLLAGDGSQGPSSAGTSELLLRKGDGLCRGVGTQALLLGPSLSGQGSPGNQGSDCFSTSSGSYLFIY